jgi:hypothetical protein
MTGDTHVILGVPASRMSDSESAGRLIHADDIGRLRDAYRTAGPVPRAVDYRFRHGSGAMGLAA